MVAKIFCTSFRLVGCGCFFFFLVYFFFLPVLLEFFECYFFFTYWTFSHEPRPATVNEPKKKKVLLKKIRTISL
jgi:hypothetical protein